MTFKIEDGIPVAKKAVARRRSPLRRALAELKVGQCVTVFPENGQSMKALRARMSGLAQGAKQDSPDLALIQRTVMAENPETGDEEKAIRIWRVEREDDFDENGRATTKKPNTKQSTGQS